MKIILCHFWRQSSLVFLIKELYWHCIRIKFTLESRCYYIKTTKCYRGGSPKRYLLAEISDTIKEFNIFLCIRVYGSNFRKYKGKKKKNKIKKPQKYHYWKKKNTNLSGKKMELFWSICNICNLHLQYMFFMSLNALVQITLKGCVEFYYVDTQ